MIPRMTINEYDSFERKMNSSIRDLFLQNESKYNLIRFILYKIPHSNYYEYYLRTSNKREIIKIILELIKL